MVLKYGFGGFFQEIRKDEREVLVGNTI